MKIVYFSNFINHHQVHVSDELYRLTHGSYRFVELEKMSEHLIRSGYSDYSDRPYVIQAWADEEAKKTAEDLCLEADVVIFGAKSLEFEKRRMKLGKLSFEVSERWLKKGIWNVFSPNLIRNMYYYHTIFFNKPIYKLCASAYAAKDQYRLRSFKDRCYKWGYFPNIPDLNILDIIHSRTSSNSCMMMWCARFIDWKHPEMPIKLAAELKSKGYSFHIDMFGNGPELAKMECLTEHLNVKEYVSFKGNLPNDLLMEEMRRHDIFIFTSDQQEGWGAVANEAMGNGCALVASDMIGSVPYLVEDGVTGMIFKSCNLASLTEKVEELIHDSVLRQQIVVNAYNKMVKIWSPSNAAKNLLTLIHDLQMGYDTSVMDGPCGKALPL